MSASGVDTGNRECIFLGHRGKAQAMAEPPCLTASPLNPVWETLRWTSASSLSDEERSLAEEQTLNTALFTSLFVVRVHI